MKRIEFKEVLSVFNINNPLSFTVGYYSDKYEEVHYWNDLAMWYDGSSAEIRGKIPLELANIIYQKYPDNQYKIRFFNGDNISTNPNRVAIDKQAEEEEKMLLLKLKQREINYSEYKKELWKTYDKLDARSDENKYINEYYIGTKEGLIIFITELQDYYLRKSNKKETEVEKCDEFLTIVNTNILNMVNPSITSFDWMQGAEEIYKNNYNQIIEETEGSPLREAIEEFDKSVNPFLGDGINIEKISKSRIVSASLNNEHYGKEREGCELTITVPGTENRLCYYRRPNGFSFQLQTKIDNMDLQVYHYYWPDKYDDDEIVSIKYFGAGDGTYIRLNIRDNLVMVSNKNKAPVTKEQLAFIYDELKKAAEYAKSIAMPNKNKEL